MDDDYVDIQAHICRAALAWLKKYKAALRPDSGHRIEPSSLLDCSALPTPTYWLTLRKKDKEDD